jgi:hypothetical protein
MKLLSQIRLFLSFMRHMPRHCRTWWYAAKLITDRKYGADNGED